MEATAIAEIPSEMVDMDMIRRWPDCPVCMEKFVAREEVNMLDCGHFYHHGCLTNWLVQHGVTGGQR